MPVTVRLGGVLVAADDRYRFGGALEGGVAPPQASSWAQTNEVAALTNEWSSTSDPDGQFALTTTPAGVRTGSKGLALTFKGAAASTSRLTKTGLGFPGTSWRHDIYMKVPTGLTFSTYDIAMAEAYAGDSLLWRYKFNQDRSFFVERYVPAYADVGAYGIGALPLNAWAKVSIRLTGGGSTAGAFAFLVNDVVIASATGLDYTGTWKPDRLVLGPTAMTATGVMYFDDGLVSAA